MECYQIVVLYSMGFTVVEKIRSRRKPLLGDDFDGGRIVQVQHWINGF